MSNIPLHTDLIRSRKSVRTFDPDHPISAAALESLRKEIAAIPTPFGITISLQLLNKNENGLSSPVISGEEWYAGGKIPRTENGAVAYGYAFEEFILKAQALGLDTVWLAAAMKRKAFEKALHIEEGEVMPAVSPLGYPTKRRSKKEILMRAGMKSDKRVPFETIFFDGSFNQPLPENQAKGWRIPLKMVRLAPSATNKQPWRVIIADDKAHFYEKKTPGYETASQGDIQKVDLGIAMRHSISPVRNRG